MAFSDREQLDYIYEQCEIKTLEEILAMCALYHAYRMFAKLSPCDATREVIKEFKKKQTNGGKTK